MPGYWTVAALLYLGGMIYGALLTLNEDSVFPLTKEERADAWFSCSPGRCRSPICCCRATTRSDP